MQFLVSHLLRVHFHINAQELILPIVPTIQDAIFIIGSFHVYLRRLPLFSLSNISSLL